LEKLRGHPGTTSSNVAMLEGSVEYEVLAGGEVVLKKVP
jgi:hypothetical protein